jgi:tetratricopeptide (TPR) repeat protein
MLDQAIALHRQGRFPEAEQAYRAILDREPENAQAGLMLGTLALDAGLPQAAVPILERAVMLEPGKADFQVQLGIGYLHSGRQDDALIAFDRALALDANSFAAHFQKGHALMERDPDAAQLLLDRAVALSPDDAAAHNLRGMVLTHRQQMQDALAAFARARDLQPGNPLAVNNHGTALARLGRLEEAAAQLQEAVQLQPDNAGLHYNLGEPLLMLGRLEEALAAYDRAVSLQPDFIEALINRGMALSGLGRTDEALASFDSAIALDPGRSGARIGTSDALALAGRIPEALVYDRQVANIPAFRGTALFHSATLLLQQGDWAEGWKLYENRRIKDAPVSIRSFAQAEWLGAQSLEGKTLFVHAEQGLGDTLQFSRYLALAQAQAARVVFAPQQRLKRLLQGLSPKVEVIDQKTAPENFDFHTPLLSMPLAFGTLPDTVPADIPYLQAEPALVEKWAARIGSHGYRIGICWSGGTNFGLGQRFFPLAALASIAALPGVRLISLQTGNGLEQLATLPPGMTVETLGEDFDAGADAFIDTAAILPSLDLVISCDTSVAHLAGAMGRPCWVALKRQPEWRWGTEGDTTPWYPTMTLFRQAGFGDWDSVFAAMTAKLKAQQA